MQLRLINTPKGEPISLITEMLFYLKLLALEPILWLQTELISNIHRYVQDIMGPMCFDYGFGPFRWVCASGNPDDLAKTDKIACNVLEEMMKNSPTEIQQQMADNIQWIKGAQENKLVVGSQARILYADAEGRIKIAEAFNQAIARGEIGYVILGRDHHDVSGTDSPYRETSNIYDGSRFTADMAIQNVIGDSFRALLGFLFTMVAALVGAK
jgi:urocanate hydratase